MSHCVLWSVPIKFPRFLMIVHTLGFSFLSSILITSILRYPWWAKNEGKLKPPGITNRGIRCVAQNFSPKPASVLGQLVGGDGAVLFEKTISLDPEHTDYVQSIYGGSGFRYCRFAVANKNLVKAWLEVEDDSSTSIVLEAK